MHALTFRLLNGDWASAAELYAKDAVLTHKCRTGGSVEAPFDVTAPAFLGGLGQKVANIEVASSSLWATEDPELAIAEMRVRLVVADRILETSVVHLIWVRDGLIVASRDYTSPLRTAELA